MVDDFFHKEFVSTGQQVTFDLKVWGIEHEAWGEEPWAPALSLLVTIQQEGLTFLGSVSAFFFFFFKE